MIIRKIFLLIALLGTDSVFAEVLSDYVIDIDLSKDIDKRIQWKQIQKSAKDVKKHGGDILDQIVKANWATGIEHYAQHFYYIHKNQNNLFKEINAKDRNTHNYEPNLQEKKTNGAFFVNKYTPEYEEDFAILKFISDNILKNVQSCQEAVENGTRIVTLTLNNIIGFKNFFKEQSTFWKGNSPIASEKILSKSEIDLLNSETKKNPFSYNCTHGICSDNENQKTDKVRVIIRDDKIITIYPFLDQ